MPRTVIYDLKGGFGSLKQINALYEIEEDGPPQSAWCVFLPMTPDDPCELRS